MKRLLAVNADDFGWSVEVNAGIIETHKEGVVTSTTLMATMPGAEDALGLFKGCPELGIGVHLTLTAGSPVSGEPWVREVLAPGGTFNSSTFRLLVRARSSQRWREAAEKELNAQMEWALERGVTPDHLDSHKHIHGVSPFAEMVARVGGRFGVKLVRNTHEELRLKVGQVPAMARIRRRLLNHWSKAANRVYREAGMVQPETLFGVEDTGRPNLERVRAFLEQCRADKVEWMVHPGNHEERPTMATRLGEGRVEEKKMLKSPELRDMIEGSGFKLVRYEEFMG